MNILRKNCEFSYGLAILVLITVCFACRLRLTESHVSASDELSNEDFLCDAVSYVNQNKKVTLPAGSKVGYEQVELTVKKKNSMMYLWAYSNGVARFPANSVHKRDSTGKSDYYFSSWAQDGHIQLESNQNYAELEIAWPKRMGDGNGSTIKYSCTPSRSERLHSMIRELGFE